jgi:hypothetical protein
MTTAVVERGRGLLSDEHFTVDGTLDRGCGEPQQLPPEGPATVEPTNHLTIRQPDDQFPWSEALQGHAPEHH